MGHPFLAAATWRQKPKFRSQNFGSRKPSQNILSEKSPIVQSENRLLSSACVFVLRRPHEIFYCEKSPIFQSENCLLSAARFLRFVLNNSKTLQSDKLFLGYYTAIVPSLPNANEGRPPLLPKEGRDIIHRHRRSFITKQGDTAVVAKRPN